MYDTGWTYSRYRVELRTLASSKDVALSCIGGHEAQPATCCPQAAFSPNKPFVCLSPRGRQPIKAFTGITTALLSIAGAAEHVLGPVGCQHT
jgi:hypothetical protein